MTSDVTTTNTSFLDIGALVGKDDGDLIIAALKALHRERASAYRVYGAMALRRDEPQLPPQSFGLHETTQLLNRMGAAPEAA